jgi:hypothetical protein
MRRCFGAVALLFIVLTPSRAQFKYVHGVLGGEYERFRYNFNDSRSSYSTIREMATFGVGGFLYKPSLAEFSLTTRFINSNSMVTNPVSSTGQHDTYFNYYDATIDFLRNTNIPFSIFARSDATTLDVSGGGGVVPSFSNRVRSSSYGGRLGAKLGGKLPNVNVGYDSYSSQSLNPFVPLDYRNRNLQFGMDMAFGVKTDASVEFVHRTREDIAYRRNTVIQEVHGRSFSRFSPKDQLSVYSNYWNESGIKVLDANAMWNAQYENGSNNQLGVQGRWNNTPFSETVEADLREQLDLSLGNQWRTNAILSHARGNSTNPFGSNPTQSTTIGLGATTQKEYERFAGNFMSQVVYNTSDGFSAYRALEGTLSGGVRSKGFSFGMLSIANQVNLRRWRSVYAQTLMQNNLNLTFESGALPQVFFRGALNYLYTKTIDDPVFAFRERNVTWYGDLTYRWPTRFPMYLILGQRSTWNWSSTFTRIVHGYTASMHFSELMSNLSGRIRVGKTNDPLFGQNEINYEATLDYGWRALRLSLRFVGYSQPSLKRNDIYFTLSRPFRFDFQ